MHNSIHSPLIISAPGFKKNIQTDGIVELVDIYPTLCDLANIERPKHIEGTSMVSLMHDPKQSWNKVAFTVWNNGTTVTTRDYSYTEWTNNQHMLFDRRKDLDENENVAGKEEFLETVERLSQLLTDGIE